MSPVKFEKRDRLGVIFDLDGVLVDSSEYHYLSWLAWGDEVDEIDKAELSREWFAATFGSRNESIIPSLFSRALTEAEVTRHAQRKEELFRELAVGKLVPLPGAMELVTALTEAGFLLAIGSSTPPENLGVVLDEIGLAPFFPIERRVCGADVTNGKPDPEVFLMAAQRLDLPPGRCLVIEDAGVGVRAAKAAGMACVGVTTTRPAERLKEAGADWVVGSLEDIDVSLIWPDLF